MKSQLIPSLLGVLLSTGLIDTAVAQTISPIQISLLPNNVPAIGKVYLAGSDTQSQSYAANQTNYKNIITSKVKEGVLFTGAGLNQLDPTRLYFWFDYTPRVYFIYGYAGYKDGLGATIATVSTPTSQNLTGNTFTIFPNCHWNGATTRSTTYPVLPGDFVQLPTVNAGQQLAFFIYSNIQNNGTASNIFYNGASNNVDNFQHMIAFFPDNSQYIIIGFEDLLNGGDKDCNDLMFVVDIGPLNAAALRDASSLPK